MKTKWYKWFVWFPNMQKYIPVKGLCPFPRSAFSDPVGVWSLKLQGLEKSFSIPFFK